MRINSLKDLTILLRGNRLFAYGGNMGIDCLRPSVLESRRACDKLYGIYLASPEYAWMSVWTAVTDRQNVKKHQVEYYRPDRTQADEVGHLGLYVQGSAKVPKRCLAKRAFLHMFDPNSVQVLSNLDLKSTQEPVKLAILRSLGFDWKDKVSEECPSQAYVYLLKNPLIVHVDAWQSALVSVPELVPVVSVELMPDLMAELRERIILIANEPGDVQIKPPIPA